jgi:flagellar biosynthesis protein FlhF
MQDRPEFSREVQGQLTNLQSMVKELCRHSQHNDRHDLPEELFRLFADLLDADLSEDLARELVERIRSEAPGAEWADPVLAKARIARMIEAEIHIAGPIAVTPGRRRLVALVGPTGVGKTTTIAKLAANYRLHQGKRVGLVTMDTYRIAAVEQLRTYANIIEVPIRPVLSTGELEAVLKTMLDRDVVLMDTAGRSQNNRLRLSQLRSFVAAAQPDEVHLVVSATTNRLGTLQVLERFLPLGANRLIVTKLDEAAAFGVFLNAALATGLPLSYVTTGQDVPEDILPADADALAECIVTGRFGEAVDVG